MRYPLPLLLVLPLLSVTCESSSDPPKLELELLGCVDEPHPMDTCADFCEWDGAICAQGACGGITARSYSKARSCFVDEPEQFTESSLECDDVLVFDETRVYYDCCCDYR